MLSELPKLWIYIPRFWEFKTPYAVASELSLTNFQSLQHFCPASIERACRKSLIYITGPLTVNNCNKVAKFLYFSFWGLMWFTSILVEYWPVLIPSRTPKKQQDEDESGGSRREEVELVKRLLSSTCQGSDLSANLQVVDRFAWPSI